MLKHKKYLEVKQHPVSATKAKEKERERRDNGRQRREIVQRETEGRP